ncbi:hypothetical protein DFJ58DRAFT_134782 [Suillus subalutaceus]|uniref:uncharacterized protein n=1 Tax=Suillus subalutaceus TaxID=48586 RepID=UPI001B88510B|nr:uncharacterized protein DFJ58DRAFT_134782 [Suillus subalutaceus]KAG1838038.1 hypothetical protein DFJ58DRAFT_134782 [Suillus subalutaceus]
MHMMGVTTILPSQIHVYIRCLHPRTSCRTTLSIDTVFEARNCDPSNLPSYQLELVLRKWYPMDRSREFRCFVREGINANFNNLVNSPKHNKFVETLQHFWKKKIKPKRRGQQDYIFDVLMTRDLSRGHVLDFHPYAPPPIHLWKAYVGI